MASNQKEIDLTLRVSATGADTFGELAGDLKDLGAESQASGKALTGAALNADQLAAELAKLSAATKEARAAEAAAAAELEAAKRAALDKRNALDLLRASYQAGDISADQFRQEVGKLRAELTLSQVAVRQKAQAEKDAAGAAKSAASAEQRLTQELRGTSAASKETAANVSSVARNAEDAAGLLRRLGPLLATAFSTQQFVETVAQTEALNRSFAQIFGSAQRAGDELAFVKETANRLGVENLTLAKSYQSLAAATKGTALEGQATRDVFEAVVRAMSSLGKSSAETEGALVAVSQIASKGTAAMEELRGQLGEHLPGALQAAAKGAGITTEQLVAMVSSGKVLASDILPALTKGLNDLYANAAPPENINAAWARFKNTLQEVAAAIGEGGASRGLSQALSGAAIAVQGAAAEVDILGTGLGELAAAIATGNFQLGTGDELADKYAAALRKSAESAGFAAKEQQGLTTAQQQGTGAAQEAFRAAELLAGKNQELGDSMLKVRSDYAELAKGADQYTHQLENELKARGAEGEALGKLVHAFGSEIEQRQAAVQVTETQAAAMRKVADAKNAEAVIAQSLAVRLKEEALRRGDSSEATRKEIEAAEQSAAAKSTEAEAAKAAAASKRIEAEAAKVSAAAYADNSSRVYELRAAAAEATAEVARLVDLQRQGKATADQVSDATTRAAAATKLYRDALADATEAAERRIEIERQNAQSAQASISVDMERAKAAREVALANGDAEKAGEILRQEAALQVQAYAAEAEGARRVAQAIRDAADTKEQELRASGALTEAKKQEIDAERRSADLKELEAEKADILAQKTRQLADSEQARSAALEESISLQEKQLELAQRQQALEERKRTAYNTAGDQVNMGGQTLISLIQTLKGWGVDDKQAERIARQFTDSKGEVPYFDNPGQKKWGGDTLSMALQRAAQQALYGQGNALGGSSGSGGASGAAAARTVNINIGSKSAAVNVASQADSDALVSLLRQLEAASASAV
jgi:tape measure domain-containing protein